MIKRLALIASASLLLLVAAPAYAQTSGTAHVTGTVPTAISFVFNTPSSVDVGQLPGGMEKSASFGYTVTSNAQASIIPSATFAGGLHVEVWPEGAQSGQALTSGANGTSVHGVGAGAPASYTDGISVRNDTAAPGAFDVAMTWTVVPN